MAESRPDGLTIVFTKLCRYGRPGEIKTISYSTADQLCVRGFAQRYTINKVQAPQFFPQPLPEKNVKVTAVCPTYNRKKYLPGLITSFLSQTHKNSELIIVDDSEEGCADCIPVNPRIRYIRMYGERLPVGEKRNLCCEFATGEIIVHFDDDDWSAPTRIAEQVKQLEESGKKVLSYYNILYWNEDAKQVYRCWTQNIRGPHGATLCYYKSFWEQNKFTADLGEDTRFGFAAMRANQMHYDDAQQQMVIRAHTGADGCRGNASQTASNMGCSSIPLVSINEVPPAFFRGTSPEHNKTAMDDLVVAVVQGLDWPALQSYANSLTRTGFTGTKLLLAAGITEFARTCLLNLGFKIVDIPQTDRATFITHNRFVSVIQFLQQHADEFRYVIWADTRDLVFQSNPSPWLEQNLYPSRLLGASECWLIKNQPMNDRWIRETCTAADYAVIREEVACCGGTLAGDAAAVYDALSAIYKIVAASPRANDQGALNYILRVSPFKEFTRIPAMREGFVATAGAFNVDGFKSYSAGPALTEAPPVFDAAAVTVYAPETHEPFVIFHQYDRDDRWKLPIAKKYQ
jgi:hypothetical protein